MAHDIRIKKEMTTQRVCLSFGNIRARILESHAQGGAGILRERDGQGAKRRPLAVSMAVRHGLRN